MRRLWLASAAVVVAGTVALASAAADRHGRATLGRGIFAVHCAFSHRNMDDPIVFPAQPGRSHDHTFFGNESTDASSTPQSLLGGSTTCRLRGDASGYWVPTLLVDNKPVEPVRATVYYVRRTFAQVQPFPAGLKLIAGDSKATAPQSPSVTQWRCGDVPSSTVNCTSGLRLIVSFPNCWDGQNLDSADHKSHFAYSARGVCPATNPVAVPGLRLVVHYPQLASTSAALSSGLQFSGHDFMNGWNQRLLAQLVARELNGGLRR